MIVDIGVHEKQRDKSLKEIKQPSGGSWGGTEVDNTFLEFLASVVSDEVLRTFQKQQMADYLDILREFETKKRSIGTTISGKILIKMPLSLKEIFEEYGKDLASVKEHFGNKVDWKGDKMRIDAEVIKNMFSTTVQKLVYHVKRILSSRELRNVKSIVLVGGFAESPFVQETFKETFGEKNRLIIPDDCGMAVLKGAVVFGHNPRSVSSRIARYTYGIELIVPFDKNIHPAKYLLEHDDGDFCLFGFWKAIVVGTSISPGQKVSRIGRPINDYQAHMNYGIYRSSQRNPVLVKDADCEKIGEIDMELDSSKISIDNTFDQTFIFGDTEIKFCTTNPNTEEECAKKGDVAGIRNVLKSNNEVDAETEEVSDADKVSVDVYDQDDVRKNSESHLTPLMYACRNEPTSKSLSDQVSTVEKLLDRGASQTDKDRDGFNALHHCALCGPLEICQLLIEKANGADIINATTKQGWTPLHIAVMQWDIDKPGKNRRNMVEYFIRNKNKLDDEDENKRTPLHIAAIKGNVDVAKLLLNSQKIDVDCKDEDGNTPLMLASKYGNKELIDLLIGENKCKIVHQNKDGMTALHYAALYGKKDAVAKLLQRGPKELVNKVT
ncbi:HS12B-like protein, partial [Mya arenaria]